MKDQYILTWLFTVDIKRRLIEKIVYCSYICRCYQSVPRDHVIKTWKKVRITKTVFNREGYLNHFILTRERRRAEYLLRGYHRKGLGHSFSRKDFMSRREPLDSFILTSVFSKGLWSSGSRTIKKILCVPKHIWMTDSWVFIAPIAHEND